MVNTCTHVIEIMGPECAGCIGTSSLICSFLQQHHFPMWRANQHQVVVNDQSASPVSGTVIPICETAVGTKVHRAARLL